MKVHEKIENIHNSVLHKIYFQVAYLLSPNLFGVLRIKEAGTAIPPSPKFRLHCLWEEKKNRIHLV